MHKHRFYWIGCDAIAVAKSYKQALGLYVKEFYPNKAEAKADLGEDILLKGGIDYRKSGIYFPGFLKMK